MDQPIELNSNLPKENLHTDVEFDYLRERVFILEDQLKKKDELIDKLRGELRDSKAILNGIINGKHS